MNTEIKCHVLFCQNNFFLRNILFQIFFDGFAPLHEHDCCSSHRLISDPLLLSCEVLPCRSSSVTRGNHTLSAFSAAKTRPFTWTTLLLPGRRCHACSLHRSRLALVFCSSCSRLTAVVYLYCFML